MAATPIAVPPRVDIVVAGGGPAGATIAQLLAGFGFQVVLLEKRRFPRHHIGESLTPSILPILDFLGVRAQVEAAGFLRMVGHTICWGSPQPRTAYYSADRSRRGFQVWREDFDQLLLDHARRGGVQVIEESRVDQVQLAGDAGVTVHTPHRQISAAVVIDASGHTGILARQGLRRREERFHTLAFTGYWTNATGPEGIDFANTILETYQDGLVWSVPLHNGLRNVTFLVDWQVGARLRQTNLPAFYLAELPKAPYVSGLLQGAQLAWPPRAFDATWYTASAFAGERFLLVGDAGLFIDPLSSEGVHKAMASAITGAVVVNTILRRPTMAAHAVTFYDETQRATCETHYREAARYYQQEARWPDHPFWQKRSKKRLETGDWRLETGPLSSQAASLKPQASTANPQSAIGNPLLISRLRVAPGVAIEQRPVIEGPFVELREVVVASPYPRGVRFLQNVDIPTLLRIVEANPAVADIMATYLGTPEGKQCPPESIRQVLARLYQEDILCLPG